MASYEPLTQSSAVALAKRLRIFEEGAVLASEEIGHGKLNLVFRIFDEKSNRGIIIKQALPYAKVVGERWLLTLKRATIESNYLLRIAEYVPTLIPKIFYLDETLAIKIMEDFSHLQTYRKGLNEGKRYPSLSKHIGTYLAKTLFYTSDFGLEPLKKKLIMQSFSNPEQCKITEDLVFTHPFFDNETNKYEQELQDDVKKVWGDQSLKLEVAKLKRKFLTEADALLHGDFHTGSIFASETETKVIDPEFAFFGPMGFDIGQFIANLLLNMISKEDEQEHEYLYKHIEETWSVFSSTFTRLWQTASVEQYHNSQSYLDYVLKQTFEDAIGFAGCEIIRRTIGLVHVADLDEIQDNDRKISVKRQALTLGKLLIKERTEILEPRILRNYINETQYI
ncbi:S-methyl-5-thioribose kinase [Fredinandcohnia quinoae]|uniref:Methylthioribose kinase n=1 Tax=Fredinandcohnia quinoae TaxID=2918902 RepID=A0AAW5ECX6_9BACI|nr:S-methyl-5-thioribose kinase [Fredinandcohnia sp. SECRCQ15]MCH1627565.1 S-methyl-5-thioribose kinase [Fredinandcohnia sp. SECRCQ15]